MFRNPWETARFNQVREALRQGRPLGDNPNPAAQIEERALLAHLYQITAREEINRRHNGRMWFSQDLAAAESTLILPHSTQEVWSRFPDNLEPFQQMHPSIFSNVFVTTRSRWAQLGLEAGFGAGAELSNWLKGDTYQAGLGEQLVKFTLRNYSQAPIYVPAGADFFYLYDWDRKFLTGPQLPKLINKSIFIEGPEGEDWRWWYGADESQQGNPEAIQGMELFFDEKSVAWIPPSVASVTISSSKADNHNRAGVDYYLRRPMPEFEKSVLWIAETRSHLFLTEEVNGLVDTFGAGTQTTKTLDGSGISYQTNSLPLRGGNTNSRIRGEVISPTVKDKRPQTMLVRFVNGS